MGKSSDEIQCFSCAYYTPCLSGQYDLMAVSCVNQVLQTYYKDMVMEGYISCEGFIKYEN